MRSASCCDREAKAALADTLETRGVGPVCRAADQIGQRTLRADPGLPDRGDVRSLPDLRPHPASSVPGLNKLPLSRILLTSAEWEVAVNTLLQSARLAQFESKIN